MSNENSENTLDGNTDQTGDNSLEKLETGGFADVFKIRNNRINGFSVIKWISIHDSKKAHDFAMKEVEMMKKLEHYGAYHYFGFGEDSKPKGWKKISKDCMEKLIGKREELRDIEMEMFASDSFNPNVGDDYSYAYFLTEHYPVTLKKWLELDANRDKLSLSLKKKWIKQLAEIMWFLHISGVPRMYLDMEDIFVVIDENSHPILKIDSLGISMNVICKHLPQDTSLDLLSLANIATELFMIFGDDEAENFIIKEISSYPWVFTQYRYASEDERQFFQSLYDKSSAEDIFFHKFLREIGNDIPTESVDSNLSKTSKHSIQEICELEEFIQSMDKNLPENVRMKLEKLGENSPLTNEFILEGIVERNPCGQQCLVRSKTDGSLYRLRQIAFPRTAYVEHLQLDESDFKQLYFPHLLEIQRAWFENPSEEWRTLYTFKTNRSKKMKELRSELKYFLEWSDSKDSKNSEVEPIEFLDSPRLEIMITMECYNFTLKEWLDNNQTEQHRNLGEMKKWIKQLAEALSHIHGVNSIHRGLKPSNIYFLRRNDQTFYPPLIIGDYGFSRTFENGNFGENSEKLPEDSSAIPFEIESFMYLSPEQKFGGPCDSKVDVYALGLIAIDMLVPMRETTKQIVFHNLRVQSKNPLKRCSKKRGREFLLGLTEHNPSHRPTINEVSNHEFLSR